MFFQMNNLNLQKNYFLFLSKYFESLCGLLVTNDKILLNSNYQLQYEKNFFLLKSKYQITIKSTISYEELRNFLFSPLETRT